MQTSLKRNPKYESCSQEFGLFTDDTGLVRCGRVSNAEIDYETKHPILLERSHSVTILIVEECHRKVQHNSVKETLTELRSRYWLVKGRQFVRKSIHRCVTCRRMEGKAYSPPNPPPLPKYRVAEDHPFKHTGIDFTGPLYVQRHVEWKNRERCGYILVE